MGWKDLDIKQKAELIKLGVQSGIRDINQIRQLYDDINTPTQVVGQSYNETNVRPLQGIEIIKQEYSIPEEDINKANDIIQQIEKEISLEEINNQQPVQFKQFKNGGYYSNNPTQALVGEVKYSKGGYENPDEPPVSESTYVEQPTLNIYEQELLNYLQSNPTAEQEYFRNLAIQNMTAPQYNQGVIVEAKEDNIKNNFFRGYNNFRYSHPWAQGLSYTPIIGDGMDLISLAGDINNKNYINAGLGLGMLALPNFIEKPIKNIYKTIKPWIPNYEVVKAIKDGRFMPFLLRQNSPHIQKYYNFNKNVATPIVVEDMLKYNENHITPFSDNLEYPLIKFRKSIQDVPKFKVKRIPAKENARAYYSSINDEIVFDPRLRKEGVQGLKGFIIPESITDSQMQTIFHEHFHGSTVNKPTIQSFNNDKYNGINNNNASAVRIFQPLVKNHGRWEGIPEEYIAELYGLDKVRQLTAPDMNDINASNIIAKRLGERFNIDPEDALWMIGELDRKGYKYGGFLFPNQAFSHKFEK